MAHSVRLVVRVSDGVVVQRLDYSAFVEVVTDTEPGLQPFGFAGGTYDPATRLVRFGARDYEHRFAGSNDGVEMWLLTRIMTGLRRVLFRWMVVTSPTQVVAGVRILDSIDEGDSGSAMGMLADAVRLVAEYDREAHAMMVEHFHVMFFTDMPIIGYQFATRACVVGRPLLESHPRARLAAALVHEAMHGALHQSGVPYRTEADRALVERICVEREAQFAALLPQSERPAHLAESIRASLDRPWWSQDSNERRAVETLAGRGMPRWIARVFVRLSRPA